MMSIVLLLAACGSANDEVKINNDDRLTEESINEVNTNEDDKKKDKQEEKDKKQKKDEKKDKNDQKVNEASKEDDLKTDVLKKAGTESSKESSNDKKTTSAGSNKQTSKKAEESSSKKETASQPKQAAPQKQQSETKKQESSKSSVNNSSKSSSSKKEPSPPPTPKPKEVKQETVTVSVTFPSGVSGQGLAGQAVTYKDGDSAFDVSKRSSARIGSRNQFGHQYVHTINGVSEFDHGPNSGWNILVNGSMISVGASAYKVKPGDKIEWRYTEDFTK